jgi:hypothetical protein
VQLRELDYQRIEAGAKTILELLNWDGVKKVVLDFHKTDYYGSTALALFLKLWTRARRRNGRMPFFQRLRSREANSPGHEDRPGVTDLRVEEGGIGSGQGRSGVVWLRLLVGGTHRLVVGPVFSHTTTGTMRRPFSYGKG